MPKTTPAMAGSQPIATDITAPLILDFLEWLAAEPRPYAEVMDGWRTSCPRLTIWEDAVDGGYVVRRRDGRLEAIVEGQPLLVSPETSRASLLAALLDSPAVKGAPRSPDGKVLVASTSVGLLVRNASRARLLRAPELDGTWAEQRDCAVSNDATHVACVRAGKVWVGAWDAP